ncbi:MAG: hypothetical protein RL172_1460 [Bacteroidota bacterium]
MDLVSIICQSAALLLATLAIAILLWVNKEKNYSNLLLIALLVILSLLNINGLLYNTQWYLKHPAYHKVLLPLSLLIAPLAYLYTRSVISPDRRLKKQDWLLLLPCLLYAINLWPYYSMPALQKSQFLQQYYQNRFLRNSQQEGLLPAYLFSFLRVGWSIIFTVLNYRLIKGYQQKSNSSQLQNNQSILQWLTQLNSMLLALILAALLGAVAAIFKLSLVFSIDITLGLFVLVIGLNLFIRPRILYGLSPTSNTYHADDIFNTNLARLSKAGSINIAPAEVTILNEAEVKRYRTMVDSFFTQQQPFLQPQYTLEQLVADLQIPRYVLSAFINKEYGMGFREFLNRYRVKYLLANIEKSEWKNYTIEAIAAECGFSNRVTFFKNFKQITGKSPSEYLKKQDRPAC